MATKLFYLQNNVDNGSESLKTLSGFNSHVVQQYEDDRLDWSACLIVMTSMFAALIHLVEIIAKITTYLNAGALWSVLSDRTTCRLIGYMTPRRRVNICTSRRGDVDVLGL